MVDYKLTTKFLNKLNFWYESNKYRKLSEILPQSFLDQCKGQIEYITDFLCERARNYLSSEKGERDIYEMLDTFSMKRTHHWFTTNVYDKRKHC